MKEEQGYNEASDVGCDREMTPKESLIFDDKRWRKGLDEVLQSIKQSPPSRERSLTITKIQEAIMWLGMDLKSINDGESPYTGSYDPKDSKVHPVADGIKL